MISGPLPDSVNFVECLENGTSLRGTVPLSRFPRFRGLLASERGNIDLALHFEEVQSGIATVVGSACASVALICQNCLELMTFKLAIDVNVRLVKTETELQALSPNVDGMVVESPKLSITELLEDDLILVLPMAPKHEAPCSELARVTETESRRPFAELSKLLLKREND